jgi:hypothetical protein
MKLTESRQVGCKTLLARAHLDNRQTERDSSDLNRAHLTRMLGNRLA